MRVARATLRAKTLSLSLAGSERQLRHGQLSAMRKENAKGRRLEKGLWQQTGKVNLLLAAVRSKLANLARLDALAAAQGVSEEWAGADEERVCRAQPQCVQRHESHDRERERERFLW